MILYDEGKIDLDAPVSRYIPGFTGDLREEATVRHLLTHRAGLPAGRDLWRVATTADEAKMHVIATPLVCRPGDCFIYSDLGADVLGMIAEAISGEPLDAFLQQRVFGPLGMNDTGFRPADSLLTRVAPTEMTPPRGYPLRGEVHDENAFAMGGVAGHAGLFSTAADLSIFAQMMLDGGVYNGVRIVSDSAVALFTARAAGTRALGWDTANGDGGSGRYLSEHAYGHTGYTGTSIWIDPERQMFVILLTNRVHAARARRPARVMSDAAALAVLDAPEGIIAMPASFRADRAIGWNPEKVHARRGRYARRSASARSRAARAARLAKARKSRATASAVKRGRAVSTARADKSRAAKAASPRRSVRSTKAVVTSKTVAKPMSSRVAKKRSSSRKPSRR